MIIARFISARMKRSEMNLADTVTMRGASKRRLIHREMFGSSSRLSSPTRSFALLVRQVLVISAIRLTSQAKRTSAIASGTIGSRVEKRRIRFIRLKRASRFNFSVRSLDGERPEQLNERDI